MNHPTERVANADAGMPAMSVLADSSEKVGYSRNCTEMGGEVPFAASVPNCDVCPLMS